jgi:tetratricopeptide (TPR) repeat protein
MQRPRTRLGRALFAAAPPATGLALVTAIAWGGWIGTVPAHAGPLEDALAAGDRHYAAGRIVDARTAYLEAVKAAPGSALALTRLARAESELGQTQKGDAQRLTWAEAVKHAREAVRLAPDSAFTHECLAVAIGRQALREGPRTRLALSREIKAEADRAIALDPASGRAWHVLAVWNMRVAGLNLMERMAANAVLGGVPKGASHENAVEAFQKAIEIEPAYIHHRVEFARLLKELKRPADARRELETALVLPPTSSALDTRYQAEARALLEKLPH